MAETIMGQVRDGVVVFEEGTPPLAEGTWVRVEPVDREALLKSLGEKLLEVAGQASGLPPDLAQNHDHYLHGQPKR